MNILIATSFSPYTFQRIGGAEVSLKLIAESMSKRGHHVTYLSKGVTSRLGWVKNEINGVNVVLYTLLPNNSKFILTSKILSFINSLYFKYVLYQIIGLKTIDICHTYYELEILEHFVKLKKDHHLNYRIVMRMAGLYWHQDIIKDVNKLSRYKYVFDEIDSVNFNTKGLVQLVYETAARIKLPLKFKHEFIGDIGASVNENMMSWIGNRDSSVFKIVVATRFMFPKRQDILIEAARLMKDKIQFQIRMIGDGPEVKYMKQKIAEYNLSDIVTMVPFLSQADVWGEMRNADILCHPTEYEGLSKIIIESMLLGLPVLASDVTPLNDYITNELNGYLCHNTPEEWSSKIQYISKNKNGLKSISSNAYRFAVDNYNADKNVGIYEREFEYLMQNKMQSKV